MRFLLLQFPQYIKVATSEAASQTIAIVNPNNGPNYDTDDWMKLSYDICIKYLQDAGVEVIGYVHTKVGYPDITGYREIAHVKEDINKWHVEYTIDGIFIDEVSNHWFADWDSIETAAAFNKVVVDYTLSLYDRAVLNPGSAYHEAIMEPYYGDRRVIAVMFENFQWMYQRGNCLWGLWTKTQGSFDQGPWCPYVPSWDDIEPLKALMDDGTILREQSAIMIYGAYTSVTESISSGFEANVGWFYVTDIWAWSETPSQEIMDEQAVAVMAL